MRMNARRATKVVVHTTSRGDRRSRRRISRQPEGTGLAGALTLSLGSPIAPCYWLRLASRHHPRQATRRARVGVVQRFPHTARLRGVYFAPVMSASNANAATVHPKATLAIIDPETREMTPMPITGSALEK